MDEMQKKHRQEQKDLQSRIMQKKKSATKKTRKGINDECAELERQLKEKQAAEVSALTEPRVEDEVGNDVAVDMLEEEEEEEAKTLSNSLTASLKSMSVSSHSGPDGPTKKPNRQKARLARRAAEQQAAAEQAGREAADLPNLREQELKSMREAYTAKGLTEHEIRSDGHCLYAAIADQLEDVKIGLRPKIKITTNNVEPTATNAGYQTTRQVAAAYISENPDDFAPFLEEPLAEYVKTIRETGEWGGHLEILALAKAYEVDINVLRADGRTDKIECGLENAPQQLWLAYYRHSFGLGEHYNSLRRTC